MERFVWLVLIVCLAGCNNLIPDNPVSGIEDPEPNISPLSTLSATSSTETAVPQLSTGTYRSTVTKTTSSTKTMTMMPTETLVPTITVTPTALPPQVLLSPMNHQWQTLNNCHRASIAILMGYYDVWFAQDDYDLGMDNLVDFVSEYGLTARVYAVQYADVAASYAVRWLLAERIPVIAGQRLSTDDNTWHYRVIHGYDDATQQFTVDDPLLGSIEMPYETFNSLSRGNGQLIPVYPRHFDPIVGETMARWKMKRLEYPN